MKRLIALILCVLLLVSVLPISGAAEGKTKDVWTKISELEEQMAAFRRANTLETRISAYQEASYAIQEIVENDPSFVPGSIERHGAFFFWLDTNGDPNGYSPSYRAKRQIGAIPGAVLGGTTEVVNYGVKGGSPASIDVAAFQPYIGIDGSFTAQYETRCNAIAQATGGVGTTYKQSNANVNNLGIALDTCGVVIFDSHGTTDYDGWNDYTSQANSSYLCLTTSTGITTADKSSAQGEFGTYYHAFSLGGGDWAVDGTAITNHMNGTAPNSLVWMAICLGMATDGLEAPFHDRGAEVVYGYSQSVTFTGDYKFEGFFWPYMCQDHTVAEACAYMKTKSNCDWDPAYSGYSYSQAVANHVAFPIVSSSEDPYLGHGNVDVIQVPNSLWTLFTQFNIAASSNNDAWGTVAVSGRQITATPAVGYEVAGYEVLSGTCTVTQNGNVFQVQAETDCEIRINFAARVPAAINFVVPEGVSVENFNGYINDVISFPEPTGDPTADAYHYRFLGWAEAALDEDSQEMPIFHKAGESLTVSQPNATYYALYKYFVAADGVTEGNFTLVTQAPASWAGDYVIVYHDDSITKVLDATGEITGSSIGGSRAAHDLEEIGGTLEDNVLYNVPDEYIYSFEPAGEGAYALKMKEHDVYLALTSNSNALMTAEGSSKSTAKWTLSYETAGVKIANLQYNTRSIRYNDKAHLFRSYASGQQQISLYSAGEGTTWFTTDPKNKNLCEEHSFGDWTVTQAPTCTQPGTEKRVCTVCGFAEYHDLDPLGHDYAAGEPVAPTCTEQGYTPYTCSRCQDSYNDDFVDALGHDYEDVVTEPGCTEGGFTTHTCSRCGDSYTDSETDPLGHDFGEWTVTTAPTCTEAGVETRACSRCDATETHPVDALGHDFGEWTVTIAPTCTEAGVETRACSRCDATETHPVDALGHDYIPVPTGAVVCVGPIYQEYICTRCGDSYTEQIGEGPGHQYGEPEWTWNEDLTAASAKFVCTACGDEQILEAEITSEQTGDKIVYTAVVEFMGASYTDVKERDVHDCKIAQFTDVMEAYPYGTPEHEAIEWAFTADPQVTAGTSETTFGVGKAVKRGDAMFYLWVAAGKPEPTLTTSPFTDVTDPKAYYYKAVLWAYENGITKGVSDTLFGRKKSVSRRDMMVFLYTQQGKPPFTLSESPYTDVTDPKAYYYKAVMWAWENGIDKGADGMFKGKDVCTRETVVLWMYRTLEGKALAK